MNCPKCSAPVHRIFQVNNSHDARTVRQRGCRECGHRWFTVELELSKYAVFWERIGQGNNSGKPQVKPGTEVSVSIVQPNVENS